MSNERAKLDICRHSLFVIMINSNGGKAYYEVTGTRNLLCMFQVCRLFHAVVSAHLPLVVHVMVKILDADEDAATLAAFFTAASLHLKVLGTHTLVNSLLSPIVFLTLSGLMSEIRVASVEEQDGDKNFTSRRVLSDPKLERCLIDGERRVESHASATRQMVGEKRKLLKRMVRILRCMTCGTTIGLVCYVRVDSTLLYGATLLILVPQFHLVHFARGASGILLILSTAVGVFLGGLGDHWDYGSWFASPRQWLLFNVFSNKASILFGRGDFAHYFEMLSISKCTVMVQTFAISACLFVRNGALCRPSNLSRRLTFLTSTLFLVYTINFHQELRFIHNVIVMFQILAGVTGSAILRQLLLWNKTKTIVLLCGTAVLVLSETIARFPSGDSQRFLKWKYKTTSSCGDFNEALHWISQQPDVTGVFCDQSLYDSAAFSILHKLVPLLVRIHHEFEEFTPAVAAELNAGLLLWNRSANTINVSTVNRVSNFFVEENKRDINSYLEENKQYNYLVIDKRNDVFKAGRYKVFSTGELEIFKTSGEPENLINESYSGPVMTTSLNATILEYESSLLIALGLSHLAIDRLEKALLSCKSSVRTFQLLANAYFLTNKTQNARNVFSQCKSIHGKNVCSQKFPKLVRPGYDQVTEQLRVPSPKHGVWSAGWDRGLQFCAFLWLEKSSGRVYRGL